MYIERYDTEAAPCENHFSMGFNCNTKTFDCAALMMCWLGDTLWHRNKKFRVTIEYDPETGKVEANREDLNDESSVAP